MKLLGFNMLDLLHFPPKIHHCTGHHEDFAVTVCFGKDDSTPSQRKVGEFVDMCSGDGKSFHHTFELY